MVRNRIVWRRRSPKRAAGRLGWTALLTLFVCGPAWLFFVDEPRRADDGAINPLALVVPMLVVLFALVLVPQVLALVRRPVVEADHYALIARAGVGRTLVLPWAQVAELALAEVDEEFYLLVRCLPQQQRSGDWPRWWDQAHLRSARRGDVAAISAYDLAIPLSDFEGSPEDLLGVLVPYAPSHVIVAGEEPW